MPIGRPALEDDYEVGHVLGKGTYGTVRLVRKRGSGEPWACKTISKNQLVTRHDIEDVRREVELLNLLTPHDNIAGVDRVYEDSNSVHIIIDYCEGGRRGPREGWFLGFEEYQQEHGDLVGACAVLWVVCFTLPAGLRLPRRSPGRCRPHPST